MELVEIKDIIQMDTGSPSPMIIASDNSLSVLFYADENVWTEIPQQRNIVYDAGVYVITFDVCLRHIFGIPNDETIHGHPYYKLGMRPYSFYELKGSDLIKNLESIEKVHPYYNPKRWREHKHYILTFHDNMFECVAKDFEVRLENLSMYHIAFTLINKTGASDF